MTILLTFLRPALVILQKDIRVWLHQPTNIAATIVPPLAFLLIQALGAAAVGRSPVALVVQDSGSKGAQIAQSIQDADVFRIQRVDAEQARQLIAHLDVVAVITIPADFTQRVEAHQKAPIPVLVNNLNLDFTNDIRRSVPDAITQYYQAQGSSSPIRVIPQEQNLRKHDVEFFQYAVLPTLGLLLTISGLVSAGLSSAREWEFRTVKELLLSPTTSGSIIAGKVLAGFVTTFSLGLLVLGMGYILGWTRPEGIYWLTTLFIMAMISLFSASLGVALGASLKRIQPVIASSVIIALYLFFLAGGTSVLAFEPLWLQNIAAFVPLTYGIHALQMAVFYGSSDQFGRDSVILCISALTAIVLGIVSMRRGIAH